ncbi:MAG: outer membrane beta-barrel protein [Pedobacter sp.]|uniref:outer membrane beta-barrel protein n=1 Tax=Pedobacter sp. TaxID=1411316 RepID=UPI002807B1A7|nr:outer membrane beta-barrel protein [Pedobacter sp.]MDQ8005184.1 outer membrane beta-barrel protein [Pedobacter sp.]
MDKYFCLIFLSLLLWSTILNAQEKKPIELNTVTVKGSRKPLKESAKGAILDITKIPDYKLLTLAEILSHIPGIEVNSNTISYMGRQLSLMRDGVNVAGFDQQIANSLNTGNTHNAYTKIELNLYNLKTEGPTLSFVAPKYDEGYFGNIGGNTGTNNSMLMSGLSISKQKHLLNINIMGMLQYAPNTTSYIDTKFAQTQTNDIRNVENEGLKMGSGSLSLSDSYFVNSQNTINASVSSNFRNTLYKVNTYLRQYQAGALKNEANTSLENSTGFWQSPSYSSKLSYVYKPKAKTEQTKRFDISLEYDNSQFEQITDAHAQSLLSPFIPNSIYTSTNQNKKSNIFGLVGYEYTHQKLGGFEVVARYFHRENQDNYGYNYQTDANGNRDEILQENHIAYNYAAILASWDKSFKDFSVRAVLKQDYSSDYISSIKGRDNFRFSTFSPYLSLFKTLKVGNLRFEAKYSQRRPELSSMSNVVDYGAQFNTSNFQTVGNPFLKPSKSLLLSNIYTTSVKSVSIILTTEYENVADAISSYQTTDGNIRMRTYRNLAKRNDYTANLSLNFYLFPRFTVQLYSNNIFNYFKVTEQEKTNAYRWGNGIRLSYTPLPNIRLGTNFGLTGGGSFQSKTKAQFNSGFSVASNIGKVNFNLSVNNFHQPYFNNYNWVDANGYEAYTKSRSRRILGSLNVSYSFGKVTKRANVPGKQITKDDI